MKPVPSTVRRRVMWPLGLCRGVTLLELLMVMVIVLMITAATIPSVVPLLSNRRTREGARMVNVMFSSARSRAMELGRPVGVWIDRMPGLPEVATTLSFCEQPPPLSGDFADSTVETLVVWDGYSDVYVNGYSDASIRTTVRDFWNIVRPCCSAGINLDSWSDPRPPNEGGTQHLVRPGDEIKLNFRDQPFVLQARKIPGVPDFGGWAWYLAAGSNKDAFYSTSYNNKIHHGGWFVINWWETTRYVDGPLQTPHGQGGVCNAQGVPYQILRQPRKLSAGGMELPETVVIDLNYSGSRLYPFHIRGDPNQPNAFNWPSRGYYGKSLYSQNDGAYPPDPRYPDDTTPVIVMFSPDGSVDKVYCHNLFKDRTDDGDLRNDWTWKPNDAFPMLFFLIGHRKNVPAEPLWFSATHEDNVKAQFKNNWLDPTCFWVALSPQSGKTATAKMYIHPSVGLPHPSAPDTYPAYYSNPLYLLDSARVYARRMYEFGGR